MKLMLSNTATTVETSTKATGVATCPNTEGEEVVTNHPEVGMNHQEEDTLELAGEATIKVNHTYNTTSKRGLHWPKRKQQSQW